jgi:hypothetical protein
MDVSWPRLYNRVVSQSRFVGAVTGDDMVANTALKRVLHRFAMSRLTQSGK